MKRNYFFIAFTLILSCNAFSQITIHTSDMPVAGHHYYTSTAVNTTLIDPSLTGANYTWDFSALTAVNSVQDTFGSTTLLPITDQIFFFGSNLVEFSGQSLTLGAITIDNIYNVYKNSSTNFELSGYAGELNAVPIPMVFSPRDEVYQFPIQYGNADSADATLTSEIPTVIYIGIQRHRVNVVDGWGKVTTPLGTFDALRVKSYVNDIDTIYVNQFYFGITIPNNTIEYKWLSTARGTPVVQVNANNIFGNPVVSSITYQDTLIGNDAPNISSQKNILIYPNPAAEKFIVKTNEAASNDLKIFDAAGRTVAAEKFSELNHEVSVAQLANGLYHIQLISGGEIISKKMMIQH